MKSYSSLCHLLKRIETRLEICEWLSTHVKSRQQDYIEECDALSRELNNLDARSDLDSTRIHVDEDSLHDWFIDVHQSSVSRYIQTVIAEGRSFQNESLLVYYNKYKDQDDLLTSSVIGSDIIILEIFQQTFKAFASDKAFGLDSYLSRRIRHGTLRGHLITPVDKAIRQYEESLQSDMNSADRGLQDLIGEAISDWRNIYLAKIDHVRRNVIQISSPENPNGLIKATWKIVANVAHLDAMVGRVRARVIESNGSYDVFPDMYALCWDCLESDLAQLRLYMTKEFLPEMLGALESSWQKLPYLAQQRCSALFSEIQTTLDSRVREVCGWFIRPVFRRDSYSLRTLVTTTMSTIRELDDSYDFVEKIEMPDDISITRGSFEVMWDVLFVLIGNAARHGFKGGEIEVRARRDIIDSQLVVIEVLSQLRPDSASHDIRRIQEAFSVSRDSDLAKAAVNEGFSGLRKLIGMFRRFRYPRVNLFVDIDDGETKLTFTSMLPAVIILRRDQN